MKIFTAEQVNPVLQWPSVIQVLQDAYAGSYSMPQRQVLKLDPEGRGNEAFALLPAWNDQVIAVKAFTYFPQNAEPIPSLHSQILLFERQHGQPLALIDGTSVTYWRTAGVSALASRFLSREESETLLLIGTGRLAPFLIHAHAAVRPLKQVMISGRNPVKVDALVERMNRELPQIGFVAAHSVEAACAEADVVVCATGSPEILVEGAWIRPGTFTDFLGNHHADHRECDTAMITRSKVYVDTYINCMKEAGEILIPIGEGVFNRDDIQGELADLCAGRVAGRSGPEEITLFKSVGAALGDLAVARAVWLAHGGT
jgi:1-pyrroline-2-carboxylate reductase [NAD(P)H]